VLDLLHVDVGVDGMAENGVKHFAMVMVHRVPDCADYMIRKLGAGEFGRFACDQG
jgi:hypothetical protein